MFFRVLCFFAAVQFINASIALPHVALSVITNELATEELKILSDLPNQLTDIVLQAIRDYLTANNNTQIAIPPIDVRFTESVLGIDLTGEFKANNGNFKNPTTIVRKGSSSIDIHFSKPSVLSAIVGFTDMEVYFPYYEAKLGLLEESGDVNVVIGKNRIFLQLNVNFLPCRVELATLKLIQFEDISMDISGLGILDSLADDIAAWILSSYETSFTSIIRDVISQKIDEVLRKTKGRCKEMKEGKRAIIEQPAMKHEVTCQAANSSRYTCQEV